MPEGFVLLTDIIPDAILEIRYYSTYNFVGTRIDGYEAPVAILTREAAEALKQVNEDLNRQGYRIRYTTPTARRRRSTTSSAGRCSWATR